MTGVCSRAMCIQTMREAHTGEWKMYIFNLHHHLVVHPLYFKIWTDVFEMPGNNIHTQKSLSRTQLYLLVASAYFHAVLFLRVAIRVFNCEGNQIVEQAGRCGRIQTKGAQAGVGRMGEIINTCILSYLFFPFSPHTHTFPNCFKKFCFHLPSFTVLLGTAAATSYIYFRVSICWEAQSI